MKKLILPILFIFLAAAAFGQTKKEFTEIEINEYFRLVAKFKQVAAYPASKEAMKNLKGNPAFSKYYNFSEKGIKPKPGYAFLIKEELLDSSSKGKDVLIVCKTRKNGKPNYEAYEMVMTWDWNSIHAVTTDPWDKLRKGEEDDCRFYKDSDGEAVYGSLSGGCKCKVVEKFYSGGKTYERIR